MKRTIRVITGAVLGLVLASILFILMAVSAHAESCLTIDVPEQAVIDQYDGDTFTLFTFGPGGKVHLRVKGVNTPERNKEEPGWEEARLFTMKWLAMGDFKVRTCGKTSMQRIEAIVERDGKTLAQALIEAGHNKKAKKGQGAQPSTRQ